MFEIVYSEMLVPKSKLFVLRAPHVARKVRPGQFVVLRLHEQGERIPLTVADNDAQAGTITIIVQEVGKTTAQLGLLNAGDCILDVLGPLGMPSDIERFGHIVCLGGGFGVAAMFPIARALKAAGNKITTIVGARNESLLLWEQRAREVSDEIFVTTDDGSKGRKGFVSDQLLDMLNSGTPIDRVVAIGPVPMMRSVAKTTEPFGVKTIVSLNPIMLDATGLCGVCRVTIGGHAQFACVDGPEFDAHQVDWGELVARLAMYKSEEGQAMERFEHKCRCSEKAGEVAVDAR